MEVVASLSQGRTAAAQCCLFTHKSVPVIFEPPCTTRVVNWAECEVHCSLLRMNNTTSVLPRGPGSVVGIATGYGLDSSGIESRWGARFSAPVQTGSGDHPTSCTMGTGSFPGVNSARGLTLTPHPVLVPCSRKSRAILLLPLWAVRPVQSLSACTRVHFTFFYFVLQREPSRLAQEQSNFTL